MTLLDKMSMFDNFSENSQFILSAIAISIVGGISNWLLDDEHTIFKFIMAVFLAGFAGFLTGQLCIDSNISESWAFFFCGAAGLSAEMVLKVTRKIIISKLGALTNLDVSKELKEIDEEEGHKKTKKQIKKQQSNTATLDSHLSPEDED